VIGRIVKGNQLQMGEYSYLKRSSPGTRLIIRTIEVRKRA
jgi:hypothetical protein